MDYCKFCDEDVPDYAKHLPWCPRVREALDPTYGIFADQPEKKTARMKTPTQESQRIKVGRARVQVGPDGKLCATCGKNPRQGHSPYCTPCKAADSKRRRMADPEHYRELNHLNYLRRKYLIDVELEPESV